MRSASSRASAISSARSAAARRIASQSRCGVSSGKNYNKFEKTGLTPKTAQIVKAPYVEESPLCIECKVREIISLGSHDMFISDVVNILADDKYIDPETGAFDMQKADLLVYSHGHYYEIGKEIGKFGWSVQKKK